MTESFLTALRSQVSRLSQADGAGLVTAFTLLVLAALLSPPPRLRTLRLPLVLLGLHVLVIGLGALFVEGSTTDNALKLIGLFLLLACIGQTLFVLLTRSVLGRLIGSPPKIFLDIILGLVYAAALLFTLRAAGVAPGSLVTGSALATAAVGLSMRDTLGNLFAGLAIQAQRPFEVGDWIQFDAQSGHIGQVIEINWRATKVLTNDAVEIIIPNATLGQGQITNYTKPSKVSRRTIYVHAPYEVPTQQVRELLLTAVADASGVLAEPPPTVLTAAFDERGVQYRLHFFTDEFDRRERIDSGVRDRLWYTLRRHGIEVPAPQRRIRVEDAPERLVLPGEEQRLARAIEALRRVDFFAPVGDEALRHIAELARTFLYAPGEVVIRQGEAGETVFLIEAGEVVVALERPEESPLEVARLGPGSFFGEMSLLTGEPRMATVRASTECELLVVDKAAFARVLGAFPGMAERISEVIAGRQAGLLSRLGEQTAAEIPNREEWGGRLLKKIREFFSLRGH